MSRKYPRHFALKRFQRQNDIIIEWWYPITAWLYAQSTTPSHYEFHADARLFIDHRHAQEIMGAAFMVKYRRFSAIHLASHMRVVWCPACHCGVVPSAAAAAAARRPSVVPAPAVPLPRQGSNGFLWGLWGGRGGAGAVEGAQGEIPPPRRPSLCIGCPGCQASLCMSCRAIHAPGIDCTAAAAAADIANAADANGGVWEAAGRGEGGEAGGDEGGAGGGHGATRRGPVGSQEEGGAKEEPPTTSTKRCPSCHVPIFKDGRCIPNTVQDMAGSAWWC